MNSIEKILLQKFESSRIICWRDTKCELHDDFEALNLPEVEKIEVKNNEFSVMHRVLRAEPKKKFLIFSSGPVPKDSDNWLLNLELTYDVFKADQASLWLSELGLEYGFSKLTEEHPQFFTSSKRRLALKKILGEHDSENTIRMKMLAVSVGSERRLDWILEKLLQELAEDENSKYTEIERYNLTGFLWEKTAEHYGYTSQNPSVKDFAHRLYHACFLMSLSADCPAEIRLNDEALVFLKRFKDSRQNGNAFETCSDMVADTLGNAITEVLAKCDLSVISSLDVFKEIDRYILTALANGIISRTLPAVECSNIIRERRQTFWYKKLEHAYLSLDYASMFLSVQNATKITVDSLANGFECYTKQYFQLDQLYRKFIYHANAANQNDLLKNIYELVENFYSNNFLLPLSNLWQDKLSAYGTWPIPGPKRQDKFFFQYIENILDKDKKVFVIVSDALRYEIAEELQRKITLEDRYTAELEAACSVLPSYTALGMSALLPHKNLELTCNNNAVTVSADGLSTLGSAARAKVLASKVPHSSVLTAEELNSLTRDDGRALFRDNDVVYIYHNTIDATGDDLTSEGKTFEAVENAITEIIGMLKRLTGYNVTNIIVTADHGFIYQNRELPNDEFLSGEPAGADIAKVNRRFVIGKNLSPVDGLQKYNLETLELQGNCEVQIVKSINRLRVKGSGSRYVHGGATLQEIVIPVLKINKKREGDLSYVDVDIISGMQVITSGQMAVRFYQQQPVEGKLLPRKLEVALYSQDDKLISDKHELLFDLTGKEPRDREITCGLVLTRDAEKYNGQEIVLKLRELESGTTYYKDYLTRKYQLRRQLVDLDF